MRLALVDIVPSKSLLSSTPAHTIHPTGASQIKALATKYARRNEIVRYVAGDKEGNDAIAKEIKGKYGRVDTIIANAGIANYMGKAHETLVDRWRSSSGAKIHRE
ncbi:hypothetical protein BJ912DRAFT_927719 [Pholiota molesta]|nr:hypothetical protein BJ912DRAFT_927719 [Pholiota molesta]